MSTSCLSENLATVARNIQNACRKAAREPEGVTLLAVSKTKPVEVIQGAYDCGHRVFGENRLQELETKVPLLPADCDWHFIGSVQRNKVRKILPLCSTIHAVDSLKLAGAIDRIAGELQQKTQIYLQAHIGGEASKHGFSREELIEAIPALKSLPNIEIVGLMCIPPPVDTPEDARTYFRELVALRDQIQDDYAVALPQLSMGMSGDYEVAIEEGATIVRVGSSIFGARQ